MLMELAEIFRRNAGKPQRIQVEDAKTEALLEDFCRQCDIVLAREQNLPLLNEAWASLFGQFYELLEISDVGITQIQKNSFCGRAGNRRIVE